MLHVLMFNSYGAIRHIFINDYYEAKLVKSDEHVIYVDRTGVCEILLRLDYFI